ncbi:MAG: protease pro-enzyme activation domain-containing protein [Bryobacteraceae bacterium]
MLCRNAEQSTSANPSDAAAVAAFAEQHGLRISHEDLASRRLRIEGAMEQMEAAFGVRLGLASDASGQQYLTYKGSIWIPKPLAGIVTAVLGLDRRPVARHSAEAG